MGGSAKATIDHDEIRKWVEERGGCPARVESTGKGGVPGVLRIDYPGFSGVRSLEKISWDEFFDWFDKNELAFLHQDETASGKISRFSKLVSRDTVELPDGEATQAAAGDEQEAASAVEVSEVEETVMETTSRVTDPVTLLEEQHDEVRDMFVRLVDGDLGVTPDLLNAIGLHLAIEEAIIYPMMLETEIDEQIRESIIEHVGVKRLIADLVEAPVADDAWWAGIRVLRRELEEHMEREEDDVLPVLKRALGDDQRDALMQEIDAFIVETLDIGTDAALEAALSNTDARLEQQ